MDNNELFTDKITKGNRTYFFDVKKSENGSLYLSVSESKRADDGFEKYKILIFEEDIRDFKKVFNRAVKKLEKLTDLESDKKSYTLDDIREQHPQAYRPWSAEDDEKLEALFCEGKTVKELAATFERKEGAITSRIKKLELKEKYS
ncbi:DUF3276 family protein [Sphingobacterium sp. DR205]|uniref:DUF3276 family protein n=1 Tax=Sphingobacterium sp. DR205 TaxID=2713573 RepID=UPI0013E52480|nr:DUF3276 family protein [Sphingobacterium sp. DR205]QIH32314.1 PUR family DNA/RNA-binding protein [Sphingobacterium sp. DR205]